MTSAWTVPKVLHAFMIGSPTCSMTPSPGVGVVTRVGISVGDGVAEGVGLGDRVSLGLGGTRVGFAVGTTEALADADPDGLVVVGSTPAAVSVGLGTKPPDRAIGTPKPTTNAVIAAVRKNHRGTFRRACAGEADATGVRVGGYPGG